MCSGEKKKITKAAPEVLEAVLFATGGHYT